MDLHYRDVLAIILSEISLMTIINFTSKLHHTRRTSLGEFFHLLS